MKNPENVEFFTQTKRFFLSTNIKIVKSMVVRQRFNQNSKILNFIFQQNFQVLIWPNLLVEKEEAPLEGGLKVGC